MGDGCVWRGMDADGRARLALSCSRDEMSVDRCAGFVSATSLSLVVDKVFVDMALDCLDRDEATGYGLRNRSILVHLE
jgi:hypothetical protein